MSRDCFDVDAALEDLRRELEVKPSPDFEHRVLGQAIDANRVRRAGRFVRRADRFVAGLICAAVALMGFISATSWVRNAATMTPPVTGVAAAGASRLMVVAGTPSWETGAPLHPPMQSSGPRSASARAAAALEFEVLVPPDQAIALRRLLAAMASGRSVVPAGATMTDAETGELLEPELIGMTRLPAIVPLVGHEGERGRGRR